ncbi:LacI family DNA-binding transcriptional regulator [Micrococcales bacterium 31B]|nr:LacI family DNA-binding transcriptional regulator [Micrococcales bacterium 31B]
MAKRTTIGDVAHAAGVTKGTVSLVFSGKRPISHETRQRVLRAATDLDWQPSASARALATSRTGCIGLVIARDPRIIATDSFFPQFIAGCEATLSKRGMALLLQVVPTADAELAAYKTLARGRVDGVIVLDLRVDDPRPQFLRDLGLPAVMLAGAKPTWDGATLYSDDESSVRELVAELVQRGHERIAHVSGPPQYAHSAARTDAFTRALLEAGLRADLVWNGDFTAASGRDGTRELMHAEPTRVPTAILYSNDIMAIAGFSWLRAHGYAVPEDVSIAGFDDSDLSAHLSPGLSTVATHALLRGERTATKLCALLEGAEPGPEALHCNELILRGSIAAAPSPSH